METALGPSLSVGAAGRFRGLRVMYSHGFFSRVTGSSTYGQPASTGCEQPPPLTAVHPTPMMLHLGDKKEVRRQRGHRRLLPFVKRCTIPTRSLGGG